MSPSCFSDTLPIALAKPLAYLAMETPKTRISPGTLLHNGSR
jgi:hypothetical protein